MLGLSGKERHAVLLPDAQPPSPEADAGNAGTLPCPSTHSSGRSGVVRPQVGRKPSKAGFRTLCSRKVVSECDQLYYSCHPEA